MKLQSATETVDASALTAAPGPVAERTRVKLEFSSVTVASRVRTTMPLRHACRTQATQVACANLLLRRNGAGARPHVRERAPCDGGRAALRQQRRPRELRAAVREAAEATATQRDLQCMAKTKHEISGAKCTSEAATAHESAHRPRTGAVSMTPPLRGPENVQSASMTLLMPAGTVSARLVVRPVKLRF